MDLYLFFYSFDCSEVTQTTASRLLPVISLLTPGVFIYVITHPNSLWKTTVLNIISGGKSLCPYTLLELTVPSTNMISAAVQQIIAKFTIANDKFGFEHLLTTLNSLSNAEDIKIGFESTAHYALNLELFLENAHHSFIEVNPVLIEEYKKSTTLRRTKTDSVDCESIAQWLMTAEYTPIQKDFTMCIL